jgi:uncharacterized membrane protein
MKKVSVILIIAGIIGILFCVFYYNHMVNPVDSDPMAVKPGGAQTSEWPVFIGIILTFVGITFYYASHSKSNSDHSEA